MHDDPLVVTALLGVVIALSEFIKYLIEKFKQKHESEIERGFNDKDRKMLEKLYETHAVLDSDGLPMWYVPRGWGEEQKAIIKMQRDSLEMQREFMSLVNQLIRTMEKIESKV